jgi:hypothetical protein
MPDEAAKKRSSSLIYDDERETLQLRWSPSIQDMDDDATKQTLELLATEGDWLRPTLMLVDATEFFRDFGEAALAWRNESVAARYNRAGATRFAFLDRHNRPGHPSAPRLDLEVRNPISPDAPTGGPADGE